MALDGDDDLYGDLGVIGGDDDLYGDLGGVDANADASGQDASDGHSSSLSASAATAAAAATQGEESEAMDTAAAENENESAAAAASSSSSSAIGARSTVESAALLSRTRQVTLTGVVADELTGAYPLAQSVSHHFGQNASTARMRVANGGRHQYTVATLLLATQAEARAIIGK